jgi:hypothetical protein
LALTPEKPLACVYERHKFHHIIRHGPARPARVEDHLTNPGKRP